MYTYWHYVTKYCCRFYVDDKLLHQTCSFKWCLKLRKPFCLNFLNLYQGIIIFVIYK